jgi:hypothetical protein
MPELAERTRLDERLLHVYVIEAARLLGLLARAVAGRPADADA